MYSIVNKSLITDSQKRPMKWGALKFQLNVMWLFWIFLFSNFFPPILLSLPIHLLAWCKSNYSFGPSNYLPMRNKLVYSCSIKIHTSRFSELLESIFCVLLVVEAFSLQNVVEMLEEVIVCWREVRWIWQMKQSFVAQFIQLLKCWLCQVQLGIVMEKNWALSVEQNQLWALQFSGHLIHLLSMLLRR